MSTTQKISILIIVVGLLLPVASLGFIDSYLNGASLIWNVATMKIGSIPYRYVFALGCILACLGTVGILFDPKPSMRIVKGVLITICILFGWPIPLLIGQRISGDVLGLVLVVLYFAGWSFYGGMKKLKKSEERPGE